MRRIESSIEIDAPAEQVWAVLTQFQEHPSWDPFFESLQGELSPGSRLTVRFRKGFTMRPRITQVEAGEKLEWLGSIGIRGIFDGRHRFQLVPKGSKTVLLHSEEFTGVLVPLLGSLLRETEGSFQAFNTALKARVEQWQGKPV